MFLLFLVVALDSSAQLNIDSLRMQYNQKTLRFNNRITMNGSLLEPQTVKNLMLISPGITSNISRVNVLAMCCQYLALPQLLQELL
jgi:aspartate carbamoyltransferase regulatory subunit